MKSPRDGWLHWHSQPKHSHIELLCFPYGSLSSSRGTEKHTPRAATEGVRTLFVFPGSLAAINLRQTLSGMSFFSCLRAPWSPSALRSMQRARCFESLVDQRQHQINPPVRFKAVNQLAQYERIQQMPLETGEQTTGLVAVGGRCERMLLKQPSAFLCKASLNEQ